MRNSKNKKTHFLTEFAEATGAELYGNADVQIKGVAPIETAGEGDISFVANPAYARFIATTAAAALVLDLTTPCERIPVLRHKNPYLTFALIVDMLYPDLPLVDPGIHPTAVISAKAEVDSSAAVGPHCQVGDGSRIGSSCQIVSSVSIGKDVCIGNNCRLYPGVRILDRCRLGNDVTIHSGAVIGSDGFGYAESDTGLKKIKQIGWVEIGDDVEIGANTTVDRGAIGATRVGRGTKIDNLVQIAHNVEIGEHCIIVSQVGISGSTKIGNGVVLAGQVGLTGHLNIGDGVRVGAQSGVAKSIAPGKTFFGSPAREIMETSRIEACLTRLPKLFKRLREIEKKIEE